MLLVYFISGQLVDVIYWMVFEYLGMYILCFLDIGDVKVGGCSLVRGYDFYLYNQIVSLVENFRGVWVFFGGYFSCGGEDKEISK